MLTRVDKIFKRKNWKRRSGERERSGLRYSYGQWASILTMLTTRSTIWFISFKFISHSSSTPTSVAVADTNSIFDSNGFSEEKKFHPFRPRDLWNWITFHRRIHVPFYSISFFGFKRPINANWNRDVFVFDFICGERQQKQRRWRWLVIHLSHLIIAFDGVPLWPKKNKIL